MNNLYMPEYSEEELGYINKCASSPEYFMERFFACDNIGTPYKVYPYLSTVLTDIQTYKLNCIVMARQLHKTTTITGYALWEAMFNPSSQIIILTSSNFVSKTIIDRLRIAYDMLPEYLQVPKKSNRSWIFDNGSEIRIQALTKMSGRGVANAHFIVDEAAWCKEFAEFWEQCSQSNTLRYARSKLTLISTPTENPDAFYNIWHGGKMDETDGVGFNGFHSSIYNVMAHPATTVESVRDYSARMAPLHIDRELMLSTFSKPPVV